MLTFLVTFFKNFEAVNIFLETISSHYEINNTPIYLGKNIPEFTFEHS